MFSVLLAVVFCITCDAVYCLSQVSDIVSCGDAIFASAEIWDYHFDSCVHAFWTLQSVYFVACKAERFVVREGRETFPVTGKSGNIDPSSTVIESKNNFKSVETFFGLSGLCVCFT